MRIHCLTANACMLIYHVTTRITSVRAEANTVTMTTNPDQALKYAQTSRSDLRDKSDLLALKRMPEFKQTNDTYSSLVVGLEKNSLYS